MQQFFERIWLEQQQKKSFLCVGLDPNLERIPGHLGKGSEAVFEFLRQIVDATLPFASCYKPQIAYFSGQGLEECLLQTISYIRAESPTTPIILDAKRNDIGATAEMYAREAFERYGADAVTLNPYMGEDSIEPYAAFKDRGLFILCRTSNPGAREFQNLMVGEDGPLYQFVAQRALGDWNKNNNIGLVVGATAIKELKKNQNPISRSLVFGSRNWRPGRRPGLSD